MKKITKIISICCLGFLLAACGTQESAETETETKQTETAETETAQTESGIPETQAPAQEYDQNTQNTQGSAQSEKSWQDTTKQPESTPASENTQPEPSETDMIPTADWNGTFTKGDEQVVLAAADSTSFEFRFAVSGIAGVARTGEDPSTGTFTGDDNNVITFSISGSTLSISVSSPDMEGESASTISGTYELAK